MWKAKIIRNRWKQQEIITWSTSKRKGRKSSIVKELKGNYTIRDALLLTVEMQEAEKRERNIRAVQGIIGLSDFRGKSTRRRGRRT